jgi:outer membrane protein assembly factor BamB
MQKSNRNNIKIATAVLIVLLASLCFPAFAGIAVATENTNYGDVNQYDWPQLGQNDGHTRFSAGPAPDTPNVLWTTTLGSVSAVFDGKAFIAAGGGFLGPATTSYLYALNPFTGSQIWKTELAYGGSGPTKIDDTYMFVDTNNGEAVYRISDGSYVSHIDIFNDTVFANHPSTAGYFTGRFDSVNKMKYYPMQNGLENSIIAIDMSNPANLHIAWQYSCSEPTALLACGDGKLFLGSFQGAVYALNGADGTFLWRSSKLGMANTYSATYYEGKLYHGTATTTLTCYNANTGQILWDKNEGGRSFFVYGMAAAYGRIFAHNIDANGGFVGCWDAQTGNMLWKTSAFYYIGYIEPALADGKLYLQTSDQPEGGEVAGLTSTGYEFSCIDAFTGQKLWTLDQSVSQPIIAYGNLYAGGTCYGDSYQTPTAWTYWRGNMNSPGVTNQIAPEKLNVRWTFTAGGPITSSPAIVNGKVYVGSNDNNIYCVDADNGNKIWEFTTGFRVASSPAVSGGVVYTGSDDGYVYAINADNGQKIWQTSVGGFYPSVMVEVATWQVRSSPIVVNDKLYVGALDGNVYCLNTADGSIAWTYKTGEPIVGSPAYSDGMIYISSLDRNVYGLNAASGNKVWNWTTPRDVTGWTQWFMVSTPTVYEGNVYVGGGGHGFGVVNDVFRIGPVYMASLNAKTGSENWCVETTPSYGMWAGDNSNQPFAVTIVNDIIYHPCYMGVCARNITTGEMMWHQWLGFQVFSSVAYVEDIRGPKLYVGCDSFSITCLNATDGKPLSTYTTGAQVDSSPAIYDGKLYVGSGDSNLYCFSDGGKEWMTMSAWSSKGGQMNTGETVTIGGQVGPYPEYGGYGSMSGNGIPNAQVIVTFTKPDSSTETLQTTTDNFGQFSIDYKPNSVGTWSWVAAYAGEDKGAAIYSAAYSQANALQVLSQGQGTEATPTSTEGPIGGIAVELIYIIIGVVAVAAIGVGAFFYTKRTKKA